MWLVTDVQSIAFAKVPASVFSEFGQYNPLAFAGDVLTELDMWNGVKERGKTATVREEHSPLFRACRDGHDTAPMQGKLLKSCRGSTRMLLAIDSCSATFKFNDLRDRSGSGRRVFLIPLSSSPRRDCPSVRKTS